MVLKEAIITRINEICKKKVKAVNEICLNGGLTPSTYYDFVNNRTKLLQIEYFQYSVQKS